MKKYLVLIYMLSLASCGFPPNPFRIGDKVYAEVFTGFVAHHTEYGEVVAIKDSYDIIIKNCTGELATVFIDNASKAGPDTKCP